MIHKGKARSAAVKLIALTFFATCIAVTPLFLIPSLSQVAIIVGGIATALWMGFVVFTLYFFRDPDAQVPSGTGLLLAPGHGKVDAIGRTNEPLFMGGECQRISIFLSVFNVHVQNAPVGGTVAFYKYSKGQFLNALKSESATHNENALLGIEMADAPKTRIGVRLIAGLIARRIVPFVGQGDTIQQGARISLIQFGSRADLYFPLSAKINVKLGESVVGGETILAKLQ